MPFPVVFRDGFLWLWEKMDVYHVFCTFFYVSIWVEICKFCFRRSRSSRHPTARNHVSRTRVEVKHGRSSRPKTFCGGTFWDKPAQVLNSCKVYSLICIYIYNISYIYSIYILMLLCYYIYTSYYCVFSIMFVLSFLRFHRILYPWPHQMGQHDPARSLLPSNDHKHRIVSLVEPK